MDPLRTVATAMLEKYRVLHLPLFIFVLADLT